MRETLLKSENRMHAVDDHTAHRSVNGTRGDHWTGEFAFQIFMHFQSRIWIQDPVGNALGIRSTIRHIRSVRYELQFVTPHIAGLGHSPNYINLLNFLPSLFFG